MTADKEIETMNKFMVSVHAGDIAILGLKRSITKDEALLLAAWLVALADEGDKFDLVLEAVQNT